MTGRQRRTHRVLALLLAAWAMLEPAHTDAADVPFADKPIRILVGLPPGGGTDIQARAVAHEMQQRLHVPVIVDNKPGASMMIAAQEVARAAPDGTTLLYTPSSPLAQVPHLLTTVRYDPFKDFTPISLGGLGPLVLVAHESVPARTVGELVAYAKAHPGTLNYASQGVGTASHLYGEMFRKKAGIDIVHVPYKGANDVSADFVTGRIQLQFASSSAAVALAKSGHVHMLGVLAEERSPLLPGVPTMAEQGIGGMGIESWIAYFGPAGMPVRTVAVLNEAIAAALADPTVREDFRASAVDARSSTPSELGALLRTTSDQWKRVVTQLGLSAAN